MSNLIANGKGYLNLLPLGFKDPIKLWFLWNRWKARNKLWFENRSFTECHEEIEKYERKTIKKEEKYLHEEIFIAFMRDVLQVSYRTDFETLNIIQIIGLPSNINI